MTETKKFRKDQPRILVYIPNHLYKKFKIHCIQNEISQQKLFENFIENYVNTVVEG
jgi:hypothetical protein